MEWELLLVSSLYRRCRGQPKNCGGASGRVLTIENVIDIAVLQRGLLARSLLEISDEIVTLLGLLETRKHHLRPGNLFLRVLEVLKELVLGPGDARVLVCCGVANKENSIQMSSKESRARSQGEHT